MKEIESSRNKIFAADVDICRQFGEKISLLIDN